MITLWFLKLPGRVIPFWKGFDKANRSVCMDFFIWGPDAELQILKRGLEGVIFLENFAIFIKQTPLEIEF